MIVCDEDARTLYSTVHSPFILRQLEHDRKQVWGDTELNRAPRMSLLFIGTSV